MRSNGHGNHLLHVHELEFGRTGGEGGTPRWLIRLNSVRWLQLSGCTVRLVLYVEIIALYICMQVPPSLPRADYDGLRGGRKGDLTLGKVQYVMDQRYLFCPGSSDAR